MITESMTQTSILEKNKQDNIFCIDKPAGITSFGVVKIVRRFTGIRKVGHAGTLDPFATGLLIVCTGKATKKTEQFMDMPKEYETVFVLGKRTDTYDIAGEVIDSSPVPSLTEADILDSCGQFQGEIQQVPPMYSAKKHGGVPLYKLARKGITIDVSAKTISIYNIKIISYQSPRISLRVQCGRGTYIRSLANDLGNVLGCGAYVESLRRTKIGQYAISEAMSLAQFQ